MVSEKLCYCLRATVGDAGSCQLYVEKSPAGYVAPNKDYQSSAAWDSDTGRIFYTFAIISLFSFVIVMLMVLSISHDSAAEVDALLDTMRFREELDAEQRKKRRLQRAKRKVMNWLRRNRPESLESDAMKSDTIRPHHSRSSPQLRNYCVGSPKYGKISRKNTSESCASFIPEIVVTPHSDDHQISRMDRARTPASLSLLFDFSDRAIAQAVQFHIDVPSDSESVRSEESGSVRSG
uniref:Uncharacterized protein n=1 Tax=Plectus sambesii TaxID=2011161 RepID=A0A914W590_9BILA